MRLVKSVLAMVLVASCPFTAFAEAKPEPMSASTGDPAEMARSMLVKLAGYKDKSHKTQIAALNKLVDPKRGIELTTDKLRKLKKVPSASVALDFSAADTECSTGKDGRVTCQVHPGHLADGTTYTFVLVDGQLTLVSISIESEGGI